LLRVGSRDRRWQWSVRLGLECERWVDVRFSICRRIGSNMV
jgi:hypothetical protein